MCKNAHSTEPAYPQKWLFGSKVLLFGELVLLKAELVSLFGELFQVVSGTGSARSGTQFYFL